MARKKKITCPVCGRSFDTGQGYAAHTRAHKRNGETPIVVNQSFEAPTMKFNGPTTLEILAAAREELQNNIDALDILINNIGGANG